MVSALPFLKVSLMVALKQTAQVLLHKKVLQKRAQMARVLQFRCKVKTALAID